MAPPKKWLLGIDLGTTNTSAVAFGPERPGPVSILHARSSPVLPSVVSLANPGVPIAGWPAKEMLLTAPGTTVAGWKRLIGRPERSEWVSRYRDRFPFPIETSASGELGARIGGQVWSFIDIAAMILGQVRHNASLALAAEVTDAVIAVPAHFGRAQRDAVVAAGRRAGLDVLRLVTEPTASALAFGVDRGMDRRVLIYDLGGGTFDATIVELVDNIFDVKATLGDSFLGGVDLDRAVMKRLAAVVQARHQVDVTESPIVAARLLDAAERAKCALSSADHVRIQVPMLGADRRGRSFDLDYKLTRDELEALTAPLIERTIGIIEDMLRSSGQSERQIDSVILVGGMTKMPLVQRRLTEVFGKAPLAHLDPDVCVAHGAALVGRSIEDLAGAILLDVLPIPIGIVLPGGATRFLFGANTTLPARATIPLDGVRGPGGGFAVGFWQGLELTSPDRQLLGVVKIPPALLAGPEPGELEVLLLEDLTLRATYDGGPGRTVNLPLEQPAALSAAAAPSLARAA